MSVHVPDLAAAEALAVELARLAGREIEASLGRALEVRYKGEAAPGAQPWRDPVSEVDHRVEALIRDRVARSFPGHGVLGEEMALRPAAPGAPLWVVDPVDGTANFVSGFPLFAASVGLLVQGRPLVGAVWCSTSHALRPGVYHAREGGVLRFEDEPIPGVDRTGVRRALVGEPEPTPGHPPWDARKTGSAAIECAFVAAGLRRAARFAAPNAWDVAGGVVLARATGAQVLEWREDDWRDFAGFGEDPGAWRRALLLDQAGMLSAMREFR